MPISSQTPIIGYVANGVTKSFAFPFAILSADDLKVKVGADVVTAGFSITGVGDRDGGSVTFADAPASLTPIILYREVALDRTTDYQENGDLLAIVLDDDLDRIWMALQDQLLLADLAVRAPIGETLQQLPPASERALMALAFDAAGNPIVVRGTNDGGAALALDLLDTAPGKGAALVGFQQAGSGAVARTAQSKMRDVVSVKDFGAVGDGVTDDTAAIQAAINTGKLVDLLDASNVYRITSTITRTGKVMLRSAGATIKSDVLPFRFTDASGSRISGIKFMPVTTPYTIQRNTSTWVNVAGDVVQSLEGYMPSGQDTDIWSSLPAYVQNQWSNFHPGGIYFDVSSSAGGTDVVVENLTGYQFCVTIEGYSNSVVRNCTFGGKREAINFINAVGASNGAFTLPRGKNNSAINNKIKYAAQCAILFWGNDEFSIRGNDVSRNGESGIKTYQYDGSNSTDLISTNGVITDNHVYENYYDGIDAQITYLVAAVDAYVSGTVVSNNLCTNNRHTGITTNGNYLTVASNQCALNGSHGISVKGAHGTVTGNMLRENSPHPTINAFQIFDLIVQGNGFASVGNYIYNPNAPSTWNYLHSGLNGADPAPSLEGVDIANRCSHGTLGSRSSISQNIMSSDKLAIGYAGTNTGGAVGTFRQNGGGVDFGGAGNTGYMRVRGESTNAAFIDFTTNSTAPNAGPYYQSRIISDFSYGLLRIESNSGSIKVCVDGPNSAFYPGSDNDVKLGYPSLRWATVYAGTGAINTSDEREKTSIKPIDAAALRAWAKVDYCQFKFKDSFEQKGDGARWHFGVIAQRVKEAFESEGLDAFAYGVLCYDEWDETPERWMEDEATGQKVLTQEYRPGGNRYGIRYEEALTLECAYLRSKLN